MANKYRVLDLGRYHILDRWVVIDETYKVYYRYDNRESARIMAQVLNEKDAG